MLDEVLVQLHGASLPVLIVAPSSEVERALQASGFIERLGGSHFVVHRIHDAVRAVITGTVTAAMLPQSPPSTAGGGASTPVPASPCSRACAPCLPGVARLGLHPSYAAAPSPRSSVGADPGSHKPPPFSIFRSFLRDQGQRSTAAVVPLPSADDLAPRPPSLSASVVESPTGGLGFSGGALLT